MSDKNALLGDTVWFEGDIYFAEVVRKLQEEGKLPKSPYTIPVPYLSVSQVEQYLTCPKRFEFRYIQGIRSPPGIAMVQGTTIHKVVEHGYKRQMETAAHELQAPAMQLEEALDIYAGELDKNITDDVIWDDDEDDLTGPKKDRGAVKDIGVGLIKTWHVKKLPKVKPVAVEKSFITSFAGIPVVGKVDLVDQPDGNKIVVDNKVVGRKYNQSSVDSKLQMSLYSHAAQTRRQRYDLFVKTKIPKIEEMLTSRDDKQVLWAVRVFESVAKAIAAGVFPECSPESHLCSPKWCGYWSRCRGAI